MAEVSEARRGRAGACYSGLTRSIGSDGEARISPSDGFQTSPLIRPAGRVHLAPRFKRVLKEEPALHRRVVNELFLCRGGGGTGEAGMADRGGTMAPFHCCPLCTDLHCSAPLQWSHPASWHRDGGAVDKVHNAACSPRHNGGTRTQAPLWPTRGCSGGLAGRWCCQRLQLQGGEGLPVRAYQMERRGRPREIWRELWVHFVRALLATSKVM